MKTIIIISLVLIFKISFTQSIIDNNNQFFIKNEDNKITTMTSLDYKVVEGKVYFNWKIKGEKEDCIYVIERSNDFVNYKSVGYIAGIGIEKDIELLYSCSDSINFKDVAYYRLKQVNSNGTNKFSDVKVVESENKMFFADFKDE